MIQYLAASRHVCCLSLTSCAEFACRSVPPTLSSSGLDGLKVLNNDIYLNACLLQLHEWFFASCNCFIGDLMRRIYSYLKGKWMLKDIWLAFVKISCIFVCLKMFWIHVVRRSLDSFYYYNSFYQKEVSSYMIQRNNS